MTRSERFEIAGEPFSCVVCGHGEFGRRKVLLHSRTAALLGLGLLDEAADVLTCRRCGYLHWFVSGASGLTDELHCPSCGEQIPSDQDECPACGWTYMTPTAR